MAKKAAKQSTKSTAKKGTLNSGAAKPVKGAPFSEQDPKRKLGQFDSAGEHAMQGGRKSGTVAERKANKGDQ